MLPIFAFGTRTVVSPDPPQAAMRSPFAFRYVSRVPSGDHAIPCGASAVNPGSLKIAEMVSGFVCACIAAGPKAATTDETRMQRLAKRIYERQVTEADSGRRGLFSHGAENVESVYRSACGIRRGETME